MSSWRNDLLKLAASQHGVVGLYQTKHLHGSPDAHLDELNGRGWEAPYPSVRARTGTPRTREFRASAAVLQMGPGAVLCFESAAAWWGLPGFSLEPFNVLHPKSAYKCRKIDGITTRETRRLPDSQITRLDGVAVIRPERLPFELIQSYSPVKVEVLIDRMLSRRLTSTDRLHMMTKTLGGKGATGIGHIRRIMRARPHGYVAPESGAESRMKWIADKYSLPRMRQQVNLGSVNEWIARVDFMIEGGIAIWVQSDLYHSALVDRHKDDQQRAKLQAQGFVVVEVWQNELWDKPEVVADRVREAVRLKRAA